MCVIHKYHLIEYVCLAAGGGGRASNCITHTPRTPHTNLPTALKISNVVVVDVVVIVDCVAWVLALVPRNFVEGRAN